MKPITPRKAFIALAFLMLCFVHSSFSQCSSIAPNAIYVVPNGSGNGSAGSPTNLVSAINMYASDNTRTPLILREGDYYVNNTLDLPSGITIRGKFTNNNGTWTMSPTAVTNVNVYNGPYQYDDVIDLGDTFHVASLIGIKFDGVHDISLRDFNLSVGSAQSSLLWDTRNGGSIYGIYATNSHDVHLLNMTINTNSAENGGWGIAGEQGNDAVFRQGGDPWGSDYGSRGGNGGTGGPLQGYIPCHHVNCLTSGCELQLPAPAGATGGGTWGASGGSGGTAGQNCAISCYLTAYQNASNDSAALEEVLSGSFPYITPTSQLGTPGQNGQHGHTGSNSSTPGIAREGDEFYIPGKGGNGGPGSGGAGGGGGGAGGVTIIDPAASAVTSVDDLSGSAVAKLALLGIVDIGNVSGADMCGMFVVNLSTAGGDGGGGGGGGAGGSGGGGGGSVYGIYGWQSHNIITSNITYMLGDPGTGGQGGAGGDGGSGYPGYYGAIPSSSALFPSQYGAKGGNGGDGGAGGDGQNGADGKKYETWGLWGDHLLFGVDTNNLCTNTIIGIEKDAQSSLQMDFNGGYVPLITQTPTYVEVSVPDTGLLHIFQNNPHYSGAYAWHDIHITHQRGLPGVTLRGIFCPGDTVLLAPDDTTLSGYYWRVYYNGTLLKETREKSFSFYPPVQNSYGVYRVYLQVYETCCGWSTPKEKDFNIDQLPALTIAAPYNTYPFCAGTDSTQVILTGAPQLTTGSFPNYVYTYPGVKWNTGDTLLNQLMAKDGSPFSVTYKSPAGCVEHTPDFYIPHVWPLPTTVPTTSDYLNACEIGNVSIYPHDGESYNFNFYSHATDLAPAPGGDHVHIYSFQPFFGFPPNQKDSVVVYTASINYYGCVGLQRGTATIYHEHNPPGYVHPFTEYYHQNADANCAAYVNYQVPVGVDGACNDYVDVTRTAGPPSGSSFPVGTTVVTHRLTDGLGNFSTVNTYVEVTDVTPPVLNNVFPDINTHTQTGICGAHINWVAPTATDNCSGVITPNMYWSGLNSGDTLFGRGTTQFTYVATDASGNHTIAHTNIVVSDIQPPVLTCPANQTYYITGSTPSAYTFYNLPSVLDNCDGSGGLGLHFVSGFGQFGDHPVGATTETWAATDQDGNVGTCSFTVNVRDTISPVVTCPDPVWFQTDAGLSYTHINYSTPTATDNLGGTVTIAKLSGKASGDTASIGIYTAIWTGTDVYGNVGECPVKITVSDREGPVLNCPNNISTINDQGACSAVVNFTVAPALDNDLSYYNPVFSYGLPSGSAFPFGTTNVVYTVADAQGNRSYCSFNVTVYDNIAPVFAGTCPHDTTLNINPFACGAYVALPVLTGTDNSCITPSVGLVSGSASGYYPLGTTVQQYHIMDNAGNNTTCSYNVNVIDTFTFSVICPPNITRNTDPGQCTAYIPSVGSPVLLPNYSTMCLQSFGLATNPGPNYPAGTTTLTYSATTASNNYASCTFTVTVVDNEGPQITSPANIVTDLVAGNCGKVINFTAPVGSDNCGNGLGTFLLTGLAPGSVFPIGTTIETYVVSDLVGHLDTASFTVTVRDTIAPVIVAPANVTSSTNNMCGMVMNFVEPVGTDNSSCAFTYKVAGLSPGDLFPLGTTHEVYVVRDSAGHTDTCTFDVIVSPVYPLQANCVDNYLEPDPYGNGLVVYYPVPGMVDQHTGQPNPCPGVDVILTSGQGSGAYFLDGPHPEIYTYIVKGTGDTVHCTTNVIVTEFIRPLIDCGTTQIYTIAPDSGVCTATFTLPVPVATDGPPGSYINLTHQVDGVDDSTLVHTFSPGFHTISWRATDYSSNSAYCSYSVKVIDNVQIGNHFQGLSYCENDVVNIDPQLQGYATGLTYQWITTDSLSNYYTYSTDPVLHFDRIHLTDQKQYTFRVTDRCGANVQSGDFLIHVNPAPATTLTGLSSSYCIYDSTNVTVSVSPAGGILTGNGINGNLFNPRAAGLGSHNIEYSWYDAGSGCTGISTKTVTVYNVPQVDLFADSLYCINMGAIQLPGANSSYIGAGITGSTFNPATAGGGYHAITRTVTENGCVSHLTQNVHVNAVIPNATITAPVSICQKSGLYALSVATTGGVWSGAFLAIDSVAGTTQFNSRFTSPGQDTIMYSVTQNACTSRDTAIINIKSNYYNLPYTFPQYCTTGAPVQFDTTDSKKYMGLGFTSGGLFTPASVGLRGPIFYAVIPTNNLGCQDTVFRLLNLRGGQLDVPNYQYVCQPGNTTTVDLGGAYDSIVWYNGSHNSHMVFNDTGSYSVFLRDTMGCFGHDTLHVHLYTAPSPIVVNGAVVACPNSTGILTTDSSFISYHWSNGATTPGINVSPGTYSVTVTSSHGCQYVSPPVGVTAGPDVTLPTITCAPDTVLYAPAGSCSLSGISLIAPSALDNCGIASVTSNAPSSYTVGITNVTWTARDNSNNTRTCIQHVTVNDTIAPFFTNAPVSFIIDSALHNCSSLVPNVITMLTASDSCSGVTLTQSPAAGTFVTTGLTQVSVTAHDVSGNTAVYYIYYQATDTVAPVITCPGDMSATAVGANTTAVVNYTAPSGAVNCTNTSVQRIGGLGSGAAFPVGVTTEKYVVTDGAGATDTCSFNVTVTHVTGITENNDNGSSLTVMPVPALDQLTVIYKNGPASSIQVKLMNATGQLVISDQQIPFDGTYNKTLDVNTQPAGTYILEITTEHETITRKIVKL